jgi:type IV secretory pathway TrbD component
VTGPWVLLGLALAWFAGAFFGLIVFALCRAAAVFNAADPDWRRSPTREERERMWRAIEDELRRPS